MKFSRNDVYDSVGNKEINVLNNDNIYKLGSN